MGWANKLIGWTTNTGAEVNSDGSLRVSDGGPAGPNYTVSTKTGLIGAAAAAGAAVYAMRLNPGSSKKAYIEAIKIRWTTTTAFTTPITATRSIVVTRGAGAAASGGAAIASATKKDSQYASSQYDTALGGDIRIATTGALTVTGITWEATNLAELPLIHVGAAGAFYEHIFEFDARTHALEINPGEVLGIRVGSSAMDAAGVWVLGVEVSWREGTTDVEA